MSRDHHIAVRIGVVIAVALAATLTSFSASGAAPAPTAPGSVTGVAPARIADSRVNEQIAGAVPAAGTVTVKVAGRGAVPAGGVAAAVLTVTIADPQASGYLIVWPTGVARTNTSNLNFAARNNIANTVITPLGPDGAVQVFNGSSGKLHLIIDVTGYTLAGAAQAPGSMVPVTPARIADSRSDQQLSGTVAPFSEVAVKVAGRGGVPASGVGAAVLTVTVADPTAAGFLIVRPSGVPQSDTSNLNYSPGRNISGTVVSAIGLDGAIRLVNNSPGRVNLIVDVAGYVIAGTPDSAGAIAAVTPARVADSRRNLQIAGAVPASGTVSVRVTGRGPVPHAGVAAAILTVTVASPQAAGHITVWPAGTARTNTSNLNFSAGTDMPGTVVTPVSSSGSIQFYNGSPGPLHLVVDVTGYILDDAMPRSPLPSTAGGTPRPDRDPSDPTFTIAVMPDTQQEVWSPDKRFKNRSEWLVAQSGPEAQDLRFVTHTGDVVNWDTDGHDQYAWASQALQPLQDAGIPWSLSNGNHDNEATGEGGAARDSKNTRTLLRDTTTWNRYFTASRYGAVTGAFEQGKVDNIYSEFYAGGKLWMVINLEMWPRVEVVNWARQVVADHPHDNVIVATHSYLDSDGTIYQLAEYGATSPQYLYDNLISQYANVKMVFSGHTGIAASRTDVGVNGNTVYSFVAAIHSNSTNPVRLVTIDTQAGSIQSRIVAPWNKATDWVPYDLNISGVSWVS